MTKKNHNTQHEKGRTAEKSSKLRLAQIHYDTALYLRLMYEPLKDRPEGKEAPRRIRHRTSLWLSRLAEDAGINTKGMTKGDIYLESIRALVRKNGDGTNYGARRVQHEAAAWRTLLHEEQKRGRATPTRTVPDSATMDDTCNEMFGLLAGDRLELEQTPVEECRAGDIVCVWDGEDEEWIGYGRFRFATPETFKMQESDSRYEYDRGHRFVICRVVAATRRITFPRGENNQAEIEREAKIAELLKRRDSLTDITDESERFRVERQIFDLEHAADEWPEIIGEWGVAH